MSDAYRQFVQGICFEGIEPMGMSLEISAEDQAELATQKIDELISRLPNDGQDYQKILAPILDIPRMSTFAIAAIIHRSVQELDAAAAYLNVGVWHGFSLLAGMIGNPDRRVIGVDNFSKWGGPRDELMSRFEHFRSDRHEFYDMDYRDYFEQVHKGEVGFYFYDGDHSYENQLNGLNLAEPYFSDNCVILVDDTNLDAPRQATFDFLDNSDYDYEVLLDQKTAVDEHPTFWNGIILMRRRSYTNLHK